LGVREIPIVALKKDIKQRMAATIRHNRARGKHQVDLQAQLVRGLVEKGVNDVDICKQLGMTAEELLRLKQNVGIAALCANREYSKSWGDSDEV